MKKEILKVCVLGLVAVTVFTGCQKKEEKVINIDKKEELSYNMKDEVVNIDFDSESIDEDYSNYFINATNKDGKTIWKIEIGKLSNWIDFNTLAFEKCDKYFYYGVDKSLEARDIQTGKVIWETETKKYLAATKIIEQDNKVIIVSGMVGGYSIEMFDINTGKSLFFIEDIESVIEEPEDNMQYSFNTDSIKIENNIISFEIDLNDASGNYVKKAGYLKVNTDNSKVIFEHIN